MGDTGLEHYAKSPRKQGISDEGGAESGALGGENAPELAELVRLWPTLPADVRASILALVEDVRGDARAVDDSRR